MEVSQRLAYNGKQKDVAEVRRWLRQFDDDVRILLAFQLLKRLADRGFVTQGAKLLQLEKMEQAIRAHGAFGARFHWREIKGRIENLCIAYVDGALKSGAITARELANRLRPSKRDHLSAIGPWLASHADQDALLVVVDDFAGTGRTLLRGLKHAVDGQMGRPLQRFVDDGKVMLCVLYAFPEAREAVSAQFARIELLTGQVFGPEVRAFRPDAEIFANEAERRLARDFMKEVGEELVPGEGLGMGGLEALVAFENSIPNNALPVLWSNGFVRGREWQPLFPRA